jgi:O-antigen/teichoic acid export membrane protein
MARAGPGSAAEPARPGPGRPEPGGLPAEGRPGPADPGPADSGQPEPGQPEPGQPEPGQPEPAGRGRSGLAEVARGGTLNLAGAAISAIATLGMTVVVTREFSRAVAGAFFTATSLFLIIEAVASLGAYTGAVYFIARLRSLGEDSRIPAILRAAVIPVIVASVLAAVLILLVADPLAQVLLGGHLGHRGATPGAVANALRALALALPFATLLDTFLGASRGYRDMRPTVLVDRIGRTVIQCLAVTAAAAAGSAALLAPLWALPYLPAAAVAWLWLRRIRRKRVRRRRVTLAMLAGPGANGRGADGLPAAGLAAPGLAAGGPATPGGAIIRRRAPGQAGPGRARPADPAAADTDPGWTMAGYPAAATAATGRPAGEPATGQPATSQPATGSPPRSRIAARRLANANPRGFWRFTAPRGLATLAQITIQRIDIVLVAIMRGPAQAAIYTAATRFLVVGQLGNAAISMAAQPRFTEMFAVGDRRGANVVYQATTAWLVILTWPLYLLAVIYGPQLLGIFGHSYRAGDRVIIVLGLAMLLATACGQVDMVLNTTGRSSWSLANGLMAVTINVSLDLFLIPRYGILGAAIGWAAAITITNLTPLAQVAAVVRLHPFGRGTFIACALSAVSFAAVPLAVRALAGGSLGVSAAAVAGGCLLLAAGLWRFRDTLQLAVMPGLSFAARNTPNRAT